MTAPRFLLFIALCLFSLKNIAQNLPMELLKGQHTRHIGPAAMSGRVTAIAVFGPALTCSVRAGRAAGEVGI